MSNGDSTRFATAKKHARGADRNELDAESLPHARYGIPIGVAGASVVAVFFLVIDWLAGRPLATPTALGSTLFLGEPFDIATEPSAVVVFAYTLMHGTIFIAIASLLTIAVFSRYEPRTSSMGLWFALSGAAFLMCEGFFVCFTLLAGSSVWSELGFLRVTFANALAAGLMGVLLTWYVARDQREAATVDAAQPSRDARVHRSEPPAIHDAQHQSPLAGRSIPDRSKQGRLES